MQNLSKISKVTISILLPLIICGIFAITGCNSAQTDTENTTNTEEVTLMKSNNFNDINIDNVTSLEIIQIGVGGKESKTINDHDEIVKKYNYLNGFKVGDKTNRVVEDNTTIYNFTQDDKLVSINIEGGDILVLDKDRYELVKK